MTRFSKRNIDRIRLSLLAAGLAFTILPAGGMPTAQAASAEAPAPVAAPDHQLTADSKITAVTVYTDRAEVTRTAIVEVPAGDHVLAFKNLPGTLVPDSLRAAGSAAEGVTIGAVAQKEFIEAGPVMPAERGALERVKALEAEIVAVKSDKFALDARKTMLDKLTAQAGGQFSRDFSEANNKPEQWTAAAEELHANAANIAGAILRDDVKLRELDHDMAVAQQRLNQVASGSRSTHGVTIPVEAAEPTRLTITLSYQVPNAGWNPLYDAHLDVAGKGDVAFAQYGVVRQNTGEDWTGVALTLSTAQPQRNAALPKLAPRWIDLYEKPKEKMPEISSAEYQQRLIENTTQPGAPVAVDDKAAKPASAGFISEYKVPRLSDVPADGTDTRLLMGSFSAEGQMRDYVRPQLGAEAFLVSRVKLAGEVSLLPGLVNLFRGDAYVGRSNMALLRPGEERDLYFGVDDELVVTRDTLKNARRESGVIASDNVLERGYATSIKNLHKAPVEVILRETLPVSRNDKLKVDLLKDGEGGTTPGFDENAEHVQGQLAWEFTLPPHEKKTVDLAWTLSWPSGYLLQGLTN
jgi:uncharacterized protein (TIGR02231 family)